MLLSTPLLVAGQPHGSSDQEPQTATITESGSCTNPNQDAAGSVWEETYGLVNVTVLSVEISLRWTDDEGSDSDPDTFSVVAEDGSGNSVADTGNGGDLSASLEMEDLNSTWTITVTCVQAGSTPFGPLGRLRSTDPGNSWNMEFTYTYIAEEVPTGPPPEVQRYLDVISSPIFKVHVALMITSTIMFGLVGLFAGIRLTMENRWAGATERWKRVLTGRLYRVTAVHAWLAFFVAAVPIGMWVAGSLYGWQDSWTSFPVFWRPAFYDITNADHVSLLVLVLWAIPLWLNREQVMAHRSHAFLFRRIPWVRKQYERAPKARLTDREMLIIYFILGVLTFMIFMVQPHGN
jgi:hypothetical protein